MHWAVRYLGRLDVPCARQPYHVVPAGLQEARTMLILQPPHRRDVILITLAALAVRMALLPWSQTVQADAVSRIHIAYEWMLDPHYISQGYWGPLHHYLNALFMMIFPGKVIGPKVLNILCASLTAAPLYGFALNVFGTRRGAVFTSLLYVLAPIVFWTSLQALSEISYAFFLAMGIFILSEGARLKADWRNAALSGIFLTCAAATRYEAWVLIAVLTLVVLLLRNWRYTLVFWAFCMLFPATWMLGNLLEFGDALYSVNQNDVWNMGKEGINDEVLPVDRLKRVLFFPWSFALNASPICTVLLLVALGVHAFRKQLSREQVIWLLPIAVMVLVFQKKAWEGSLMMHHRFVVSWLVLGLPFMALVFQGYRWPRARMALMTLGLVTVIPLSQFWNKVPYQELLGDNLLGRAMDELAMGYYREMQVLPSIHGTATDELLDAINARSDPGMGLIVDFFGWDKTYYISLHAQANTVVVGGAKHETYEAEVVSEFLGQFRQGHVVFSRTGMLREKAELKGSSLVLEGVDLPLVIEGPERFGGQWMYAYRVADSTDATVLASRSLESAPVFPAARDADYFHELIRSNEPWFNSVRRQAFWKREPLDSTMQRNVAYMLSLEAEE